MLSCGKEGMPITYRFESNALAIFRLTGTVPDAAVMEMANRFLSDERVRPGVRILSDHRELQSVITTDALHDIHERVRSDIELLEGARIALVSQRPACFGMMRLFTLLAHALPIKVRDFRDMEDAAAWLQPDVKQEFRIAPRLTAEEAAQLRVRAQSEGRSVLYVVASLIEADLIGEPRPRTERVPGNGDRSPLGIRIRLTDEHRVLLSARADRHRLSISGYVQMVLTAALREDESGHR